MRKGLKVSKDYVSCHYLMSPTTHLWEQRDLGTKWEGCFVGTNGGLKDKGTPISAERCFQHLYLSQWVRGSILTPKQVHGVLSTMYTPFDESSVHFWWVHVRSGLYTSSALEDTTKWTVKYKCWLVLRNRLKTLSVFTICPEFW